MPANRIGNAAYSVAQLKILQEVVSLTLFVPFSLLYLREPFKLDFVWAGLCMCGAVYFMFRGYPLLWLGKRLLAPQERFAIRQTSANQGAL